MARIAFGGFQHETNTFAPHKTDLRDFEMGGAYPPLTRGEALFDAVAGMNLPISGFIEDARAAGHQLVPLSWSMAVPAAAVTDKAYETITGWLLADLTVAGALDAVYLDLHGAMVAERFEDGEGELLRRVREIVGPDMPVVVSLDLHANMTPAMIEHASALIAFRTYPHVDRADTGRRCASHLHGLLSGNGAPFKAFRQIPYIIPLAWQCTLVEPAVTIIKTLENLEGGDAQSLSFTLGFPLADIHDCGPAVFGYGRTQASADRAVAALAEEVERKESAFAGTLHAPDDAVARAMKRTGAGTGPVIIADTQDNPGAGGTEDTIGVLESLVRQDAQGALVVFIYDVETAAQAHAAGEGAEIEAALGAKSGLPGEAPLCGTYLVEKLGDGQFIGTGPMFKGLRYQLGPMALLRTGGVRVIVSSKRAQAADQSILRHFGLEAAEQKIIALKSSVHFRADFSDLAREILIVESPGLNTADTTKLHYKHLRSGLRVAPLGPTIDERP